MGLFSQILKLHTGSVPLEDFFTEIVAHLLNTNQDLLLAWLQDINVLSSIVYSDTHVSTQKSFHALAHHDTNSRPDMLIELVGANHSDLIFMESKIGSHEGEKQLQKYAEILGSLSNFQNKALIYITRDFDPKDESSIFENITSSNIQFKQLRWYQFYQFLSSQQETELIREICSFMQQQNMAHNNQFLAIDILALSHFSGALNLMDEIINREVKQEFEKVIGQKVGSPLDALKALPKGNYNLTANMPSGKWFCCLGFWLSSNDLSAYPRVALWIGVDNKSPKKSEITEAMKEICDKFGWRGEDLDKISASRPRILKEKSLQDFMSHEDHIVAIKGFFLEAIKELETIKKEYPSLPWNTD